MTATLVSGPPCGGKTTYVRRAQRGQFKAMHHASSIVVVASEAVCLERAKAERPPEWQAAVSAWFRAWEPSRSGGDILVRTDT